MSIDWLELAQGHSSAKAFEAAALAALQRSVGCDVALLLMRGAETAPSTLGLGSELVARAVRGGPRYFEELLPVKRAALAGRGVAVDTHVLGERAVRRSAYFRDLGRNVGARHEQLMAYVPLRGQIVAALMLGRAAGGFSDAEIAAVEATLPALGVARGSYGVPVVFEPLGEPERPLFARGLDAIRPPPPHAQLCIGDVHVQVRDRLGYREMVALRGQQELVWTRAALSDPARSGWPYVELLHLAAVQARARERALFIGCGGAVALRQFARLYPGIELELVEREPAVVELARQWFALDAIPLLDVHVAEGSAFVQRAAPGSWDILVVDAFDSSEPTPPWLEPAWLVALERALRPGGALAINAIGTLERSGPVRELVAALQARFEHLRVVPVMNGDEAYSAAALRNVVIVASRRG